MTVRRLVAATVLACTMVLGGGQVAFGAQPVPPYDRDAFGDGWADLDGDCQDTRQEILIRDLVDEVLTADGCDVATGTLHDAYTGHTISFRRGQSTSDDVQIDHVIPLAYAWRSGAWQWTDAERKAFSNDPANLRAVGPPCCGPIGPRRQSRDSPTRPSSVVC
jgi:hypothetical protein